MTKVIKLNPAAETAFQALRDTLKQQAEANEAPAGSIMIAECCVTILEEMLRSMETNSIITYERLKAIEEKLP